MQKDKQSLLLVSAQPIQNAAPFQLMAKDPRVDMLTAFCSLPDAKLWGDPEHLTRHAFDIPMLDGYPWKELPNYSPAPSLGKFYGLINPGVISLVSEYDCCVIFGHSYVSFWLAILASKLYRKPVILTTDATYLDSQYGGSWKARLKKKILPALYNRVADLVLVPSTASKRFVCSLGVSEERVVITPYVVDNDYIADVSQKTDREKMRGEWQIPQDAAVIIFCAKFLPRKRPQDALRAFAKADVKNSYLMMIGDGLLADSLKAEAEALGIAARVRFPGLVNYSSLPEYYTAGDLLLFPSEHEPYGLPVNEAMICGIPAVVSNRVGAGYDLVEKGSTGFVYPCGDTDALAAILRDLLQDREALRRMGENARMRMKRWSPRENVEATLQAMQKAIASRSRKARAR